MNKHERYKPHPAANLFPLMSSDELAQLVDDVRENGMQDPIEIYQAQILDGRNRYLACIELGMLEADIDTIDVTEAVADPIAYSLSRNLHRRHLTESQRAMVAANVANITNGDFAGNQHEDRANLPTPQKSNAEAASMLNVSPRTVKAAKKVKSKGAPELVEAVEKGEVAVSAAAEVASLSKKEQKKVVGQGREAVTEAAKQVRIKKKKYPATQEFDRMLGLICSHKLVLKQSFGPPKQMVKSDAWDPDRHKELLNMLGAATRDLNRMYKELTGEDAV